MFESPRAVRAMAGPTGRSRVSAMSRPPDLAVVGNGRIAALVNNQGQLVWWCFPRFDSDPVFCRLIAGDEEKGFCDVAAGPQGRGRLHL